MNAWRKIGQKRKLIGWLLIAALAFLTVLPAHVHLHHVESPTTTGHGHEHSMDMHIYSSELSSSHHDEAQVLMATPDGVIKVLAFKIISILLIGILLAIVPFVLARFVPRQKSDTFLPIKNVFLFAPPLRGPPQ